MGCGDRDMGWGELSGQRNSPSSEAAELGEGEVTTSSIGALLGSLKLTFQWGLLALRPRS